MDEESPYMLLVAKVLDEKKIKMTEDEKNLLVHFLSSLLIFILINLQCDLKVFDVNY